MAIVLGPTSSMLHLTLSLPHIVAPLPRVPDLVSLVNMTVGYLAASVPLIVPPVARADDAVCLNNKGIVAVTNATA